MPSSLRPGGRRPSRTRTGSVRDQRGRGYVVQVDGAQLGRVSRQAQPAHPAARAQRPCGDHDVVVEPAGQLDPGAVAGQLVDQRRDRRRPRAAPRTSAGSANTARSAWDRSDSAASNSSRPALRAWCAASSSTSRLGGSSTSEEASSSVAPDRRSSWASSVPRATSMRWCIRSSRLAVQVSQRPDDQHHDEQQGEPPAGASHAPFDDGLVDPQDLFGDGRPVVAAHGGPGGRVQRVPPRPGRRAGRPAGPRGRRRPRS